MKRLFFTLLFLLCPVIAQANFSAFNLKCNNSGAGGESSDTTCSITTASGTNAYILIFNGSGYTSATISDSHGDTWTQATHCGTSQYQTYMWYVTVTGSATHNITITITGTAVAHNNFAYEFSGGSPPADALDSATCCTFTSNAATQSTSSTSTCGAGGGITLVDHDALVASIVCNSGNTGTAEFAPVSPLVSGTGENGGATNSFRSAHVIDNTPGASGVQAQFTSVQGCSFGGGLYGVMVFGGFKSAATGSGVPRHHGVIIDYRKRPHSIPSERPRSPWDNRRRRIAAPEIKT